MDALEAIRTRRSVRKFKSRAIPDSALYTILESARWAPSANNLQPWQVIVVEDEGTKKLIAEESLEQDFIADAPIVLVICSRPGPCEKEFEELGEKFCTQSVAAAVQNILITANSLGLGACWIGSFAEAKLRKELKLPEGISVDAIIPIGWPAEKTRPAGKRELADFVFFEKYGNSGRGSDMFPISEQIGKIKKGLKEFAHRLKNK